MLEFTPQLIFKNTGRRVDIDTLTLMPDHIADRVEKYNRLRNEGLRGDELAKAMGFASRGSLSVWAKKYIKTNNEPTKPTESTEPTEFTEPSNTTDPVEPTNTTDTVEHNIPSEPQPTPEPTQPSEPKESSDPTDPTAPPGQSSQPY